ncbi:MAG TPA: heavy metal-binding domain-containing protein [Beijerinckiaceae bacterium]|nr:heavy metal-binding domain-containing protein [Beijerinckiaceae bacterium]HVB90124.1 heavy metal-binding domain-containing protein [Beijerinckiaceae bacterium]
MRISKTNEIEGRRILCSIGRIEAASAWHACGVRTSDVDWKALALQKLMQAAEEFEADAIVEVDYAVDDIETPDLGLPLQRVCAKGVAVRLALS